MEEQSLSEYEERLDEQSRRNLNKFARFMARMIDKYGEAVLQNLDENKEIDDD